VIRVNSNGMVRRFSVVVCLIGLCALNSCADSSSAPEILPPLTTTFLKDVVESNLPSPYYHFEYDANGVMTAASFASGLLSYQLTYENGRLSSQVNTAGNHDQLAYDYDDFGRAAIVEYKHDAVDVFAVVTLVYEGQRLIRLERRRRLPNHELELNKELSFTYYANGNLQMLTTHTPAIAGVQPEATYEDLYEDYDDKVNVDAFTLIHAEFFDHLVLLPTVVLQKNNARRVTRSGDVDNYQVDYSYTYDSKGRPLSQNGTLMFTSGANAGQQFQTQSVFTYY